MNERIKAVESVALLVALALFTVAVVRAYRMGYADAQRADAPLLAPPTTDERAR